MLLYTRRFKNLYSEEVTRRQGVSYLLDFRIVQDLFEMRLSLAA